MFPGRRPRTPRQDCNLSARLFFLSPLLSTQGCSVPHSAPFPDGRLWLLPAAVTLHFSQSNCWALPATREQTPGLIISSMLRTLLHVMCNLKYISGADAAWWHVSYENVPGNQSFLSSFQLGGSREMRHMHSVSPTWWGLEWASQVHLMVGVVYKNPLENFSP